MALKGKFHIPSAKEMEEPLAAPSVQSLFHNRKTLNASENTSNSTATNSGMSRPPKSSQTVSKQVNNQPDKTSGSPVVNGSSADSKNSVVSAKAQNNQASFKGVGTTGSGSVDSTSSPKKSHPAQPIAQNSPVKPSGKTNSIIVSARQRGNPILKFVRNVPWEFGDIVPDYQLGQTSCALFLSLRYHQLNPNYIHERLKQLGHTFDLRVLLVHVDVTDPHSYLKELAKMCILADCTLILAFSAEEAGRYLETYKSFESKPPDLIMEKSEGNLMARLTDTLTRVRRVNKTDVVTLMSAFGSFKDIVQASEEDISLCPGFGPQKAKRLYNIFQEPFLKAKRKTQPNASPSPSPSTSPLKKPKNS